MPRSPGAPEAHAEALQSASGGATLNRLQADALTRGVLEYRISAADDTGTAPLALPTSAPGEGRFTSFGHGVRSLYENGVPHTIRTLSHTNRALPTTQEEGTMLPGRTHAQHAMSVLGDKVDVGGHNLAAAELPHEPGLLQAHLDGNSGSYGALTLPGHAAAAGHAVLRTQNPEVRAVPRESCTGSLGVGSGTSRGSNLRASNTTMAGATHAIAGVLRSILRGVWNAVSLGPSRQARCESHAEDCLGACVGHDHGHCHDHLTSHTTSEPLRSERPLRCDEGRAAVGHSSAHKLDSYVDENDGSLETSCSILGGLPGQDCTASLNPRQALIETGTARSNKHNDVSCDETCEGTTRRSAGGGLARHHAHRDLSCVQSHGLLDNEETAPRPALRDLYHGHDGDADTAENARAAWRHYVRAVPQSTAVRARAAFSGEGDQALQVVLGAGRIPDKLFEIMRSNSSAANSQQAVRHESCNLHGHMNSLLDTHVGRETCMRVGPVSEEWSKKHMTGTGATVTTSFLANFVQRLRSRFLKGKMSRDRIDTLEGLGFVWDKYEADWEVRWWLIFFRCSCQ